MPAGFDAVTFDFWDTLFHEPPGYLRTHRIRALHEVLAHAGAAVDEGCLTTAFDASWDRYCDAWERNDRQYLYEQAVDDILRAVGAPAEGAEGRDLRDAARRAFARIGREADLVAAGHVEGAVRALRDRGVRVGIVCDVGMTASPVLREHLRRRALLELFDHCSFSDEVGVYKPSAAIFEHALAGLGAHDPARVAHVGDRRRTDVAGALGMGMVAVRYTGFHDDDSAPAPEGHHVVASHADLLPALGLA